jgi:hypothetical protein
MTHLIRQRRQPHEARAGRRLDRLSRWIRLPGASGSGTNRVNPIHGADLPVVCVDALEGEASEIEVGGPQTLTWNEVAALAFGVLGSRTRVTHIPEWVIKAVVPLVRLFNWHQGELLAFFTTVATTEVVAPPQGTRTLEQYYHSLGEGK